MKAVVLLILLAILVSLGSGLYFLIRDREGSPRLLKALKIRIGLSAALILFLVVSYLLGWISP
jgi:succinate dehydrogenase hydrophobic anchor subunit